MFLTALVTAITTAVTGAVKALAVVGMAVEGLKVIGNTLVSIAKSLGLIKPETDVQELGDKALQAEQAGITPEQFASYAEYVKEIENFTLDPEKSKLTTEDEKIKKGIEIGTCVVSERFPELPFAAFFNVVLNKPEFFKESIRTAGILALAGTDGKSFTDVVNFISGAEKNDRNIDNAVAALKKIEKDVQPGISDSEAFKAAVNLRQHIN